LTRGRFCAKIELERGVKNFEENLERLERLGVLVKNSEVPLDEALKAFEEGIKLAKQLEKELARVESRVEILLNNPDAGNADAGVPAATPQIGLFSETDTAESA
jgi:exodeoxyribonuclease VII small subunit